MAIEEVCMSGKRYTDEFKIEAVKQVTELGHSVKEVAHCLGITPHSLYGWKAKFDKLSAVHRVDLGDAQRKTNRRVRGRTATLAQDLAAARETDDVVHGQEVALVGQLGNRATRCQEQRPHSSAAAHQTTKDPFDGEVLICTNLDRRIGGITRQQANRLLGPLESLDRQFAVQPRHHGLSVMRVGGTMHPDQIAIEDPVLDHRVALHPQQIVRDS